MTRFITGITEDTYYSCVDALTSRFCKCLCELPDGLLGVELDDNVIMKSYGDDGRVILDLGGKKTVIDGDEYNDIVIK